jgi:hypothetical protein
VGAAVPPGALSDAPLVAAALVPLERMLPAFAAVVVNQRGRTDVTHGRDVGPEDVVAAGPADAAATAADRGWVRIFDAAGTLIALGSPGQAEGSLHPSVVLL